MLLCFWYNSELNRLLQPLKDVSTVETCSAMMKTKDRRQPCLRLPRSLVTRRTSLTQRLSLSIRPELSVKILSVLLPNLQLNLFSSKPSLLQRRPRMRPRPNLSVTSKQGGLNRRKSSVRSGRSSLRQRAISARCEPRRLRLKVRY